MDRNNIFNKKFFNKLNKMLQMNDFKPFFTGINDEFVEDACVDLKMAQEFIEQYKSNQATYNSYRREIEKLFQWLKKIARKSIADLKRQDLENYILFCQHPPKDWIATKKYPRQLLVEGEKRTNPNWRPFVVNLPKGAIKTGAVPIAEMYSLSEKALAAMFAIVNSFFNYMVQTNYVAINPLVQIKQKSKYFRKQQEMRIIRRLSELQWAYVIETTDLMTQENKKHERTLFILSCLYGMYLRISELSCRDSWRPVMGHFFRDHDGLWWFKTVGKGNKERDISVSDSMLKALKRYRLYLGLTELPVLGENTPLLMQVQKNQPLTSTRQIRDIVQIAFDKAVERLEEDGFADEASQLKAATVHWLRHTGISDDVKLRPREHVRDDAGHSSSAITDKYIDIEKRARHSSAKGKFINPDDS